MNRISHSRSGRLHGWVRTYIELCADEYLPALASVTNKSPQLNLPRMASRCRKLVGELFYEEGLMDLYSAAWAGERGPSCRADDIDSTADTSFIDPDLREWMYSEMHLDKNGVKKTTPDRYGVFRSDYIWQPDDFNWDGFESSARAVMPAVGAQAQVAGKAILQELPGIKKAMVDGVQQLGQPRFWSSLRPPSGFIKKPMMRVVG